MENIAILNPKIRKQVLISGCLYMGQMLCGYVIGWTAPVIPKLQDPAQTPLDHLITDAQASWLGSTFYIGTIAGPYVSGYLSNIIGRKPCLLLSASIALVGFTLIALANTLGVIYAGRILSGMGVGMIFVINLVFIGEIASTNIRGILLTLTGFSSTVGTLVIYSVGPFVPYSVTGWLATVHSSVYIILVFFFVPETPVYQIMTGKNEEAIANLTSLGRKDDINIVFALASEKTESKLKQMTDIYTNKCNRKALFLILVLLILQQLSGVIAVIFFVTSIFEQTGSNLESYISTIIIGVTQVVAGSIAPLFVERTGRKSLLLVSTLACSLSLAALGIYFHLYNTGHPAAKNLSWLSLSSLMVFFIAYFVGFGIIPNTFIGEMFTANVRSFGSTFTVTISWSFGFGVATAFGYMLPAWGAAVTFWIYSGACAIAFVFTIVFVPETKGKTLLEIQEMLSK